MSLICRFEITEAISFCHTIFFSLDQVNFLLTKTKPISLIAQERLFLLSHTQRNLALDRFDTDNIGRKLFRFALLFYLLVQSILLFKLDQFVLSSWKIGLDASNALSVDFVLAINIKTTGYPPSPFDSSQERFLLLYQIQIEDIFQGKKFVISDDD